MKALVALVVSAAAMTAQTAAAAQQDGLVNVYAADVGNDNEVVLAREVTVTAAANFCGIDTVVLTARLSNFGHGRCEAYSTSTQESWVTHAAPAGSPGVSQSGLVNVYAQDIASGNEVILLQDVSIPVAASLCAVQADLLTVQLKSSQRPRCGARSSSVQWAWVEYAP